MIFRFLHRFKHLWRYRNPYDRTCRVCGLRQNAFTWGGAPQTMLGRPHWWEGMNSPTEVSRD